MEFLARMPRILERYSYLVVERVDAGERPCIAGHAYANPFRNHSAHDWASEAYVRLPSMSTAERLLVLWRQAQNGHALRLSALWHK